MPNAPYECYLMVEECRSGEVWYKELKDDDTLDLEEQVDAWIDNEYDGEMKRDGDLLPGISGDYCATIKTDWNAPDSVICWESGGFYLRDA